MKHEVQYIQEIAHTVVLVNFFEYIAISNFKCCFIVANSISFGIFSESCIREGVHFFKDNLWQIIIFD